MAESWVIQAIVGTALGFLAGLGTGGGSLLMIWLVTAASMEPEAARVCNLLFFLPSALVTSCFRWKQGSLSLKTALPGAIAGCVGASLACWLFSGIKTGLLQILFGVFLIIAGLREVFYRPRKAK